MGYQLTGKRVVFIGRFKKYKKKDAIARLELQGGIVQDRLINSPSVVVIADLDDLPEFNESTNERITKGNLEVMN